MSDCDGIISFIAACFCLHGQLVEQHKNAFDTTCCSLSHYNSVTQYNTHTPGNHTQRIIINKYMELSQSLSQTYDPFVSNNYTWFHHFNINKKSQINGILLWNVNNITQWSCPIENAEFYEVIRAVLSLNGSGRILFETTDDAAHILSIYNEHHNTHNISSLPTNMNITFSANIRLYLPFNSISKSSTAISRNNNIISSTLIQSIDDNINMNVPDYKSTTILPVPTISHNLNVHIHTHEKRLSFATGDKYKDKCIGLKGIGAAVCKYNPFCGSETDNHTPGISVFSQPGDENKDGIKLGEYNCGYELDKDRLKTEMKNELFGDSATIPLQITIGYYILPTMYSKPAPFLKFVS